MTPERWAKVSAVLADALEQPGAARQTFVASACGDDTALRDEVLGLLAQHGAAEAYFDDFAADLTPDGDRAGARQSLVGSKIGPYELLEQIGRGGMGVVYRAQRSDGAFEQEVALKLLPIGMSDAHLARFEAERQILAPLQHPNIARLLDGGLTADGTPYFVMDYVSGQPITTYCDQQALSVAQRLALFDQVCAAVQYAHQNLVVHRDLKPSNILVTGEGQVKLLDFGIAKLLDPAAAPELPLTRTGLRLMTPEYASPEQIRGETVTTSSDVYQLGVLLYELLSGKRPYRLGERAVREMERVILEEEPTRPSIALTLADGDAIVTSDTIGAARATPPQRLKRQLTGDLDQIVLKALHKQTDRRYASVEALVQDVARHRNGLPVLAQPDSWAYRAGKFARRHRVTLGAATLSFLALAVGLGAALHQSKLAAEQRDAAIAQEKVAAEVGGFMRDMFSYFAFSLPDDVSPTPLEVLGEGVLHADDIEKDDPELAGAVLKDIADLHIRLQAYEQADVLLKRALDLRASPRHQAVTLERLATSARLQGDLARARPLYERAVALGESSMAADDPDLAFMLNTYGIALSRQEELQAAETLQRRVVQIRRSAPLDQTANLAQLTVALDNLGVTLAKGGRLQAALENYEEAYRHRLTVEARMAGISPDVPWSLFNLLGVRSVLETPDATPDTAEAFIERTLQSLGPTHRITVGLRRLKADLLRKSDKLEQAGALVRQAQKDNANNPYTDGTEAFELALLSAGIKRAQGQTAAAEATLRALWEDAKTPWEQAGKSAQAGRVACELGLALASGTDALDEAQRWLDLCLEIEQASRPEDHYLIGKAHLHLAEALAGFVDTTAHVSEAARLLNATFGPEHSLSRRAVALVESAR